jgi:hypothetical protein
LRQYAHINLDGLVPPPFKPLLQYAQQFGLNDAEISPISSRNRKVVGQFKKPLRWLMAPLNAPFSWRIIQTQ